MQVRDELRFDRLQGRSPVQIQQLRQSSRGISSRSLRLIDLRPPPPGRLSNTGSPFRAHHTFPATRLLAWLLSRWAATSLYDGLGVFGILYFTQLLKRTINPGPLPFLVVR